jgi:hypothetical protein
MSDVERERSWLIRAIAVAATGFGLLTIKEGGAVLFVDGEYERRTVVAMSLRTVVWTVIAAVAWRQMVRSDH